MSKLIKYEDRQKKVGAKPSKPKIKSGVACTEIKCKGEMLIHEPEIVHPEYPKLKRASCNKCKWRGWV